jgi:hypothetical protein
VGLNAQIEAGRVWTEPGHASALEKKVAQSEAKRGMNRAQIDGLADQVLLNCAISDARHVGLFSVCGLALRLRDLYKWENRLEPWVEEESSKLLNWIGQKEDRWDGLLDRDFDPLDLDGRSYDPFDVREVNEILEPMGLIYGAGYVQSLKPTFFLAALDEKREMQGTPIYILGRELARDILTLPALAQDQCIFVRKESARYFLWDQIFFVKKSGRAALDFALGRYGVEHGRPESLRQNLGRIANAEVDVYVHHELGEVRERSFDRDLWRNLIASFPHSPIEFLARVLKDLLADTNPHGKLRFIAEERREGSLAFHVAFMDDMRRILFPALVQAFDGFMDTGEWPPIEEAILKGHDDLRVYADRLTALYAAAREKGDMEWGRREISAQLLHPLGLGRKRPESA